jgi:hypothetical protein
MPGSNNMGSFPRTTPEEQGLPSKSVLDFLDSLEAGKYSMHSLMLLRHGKVLAEGWWAPYDPGCRRYLYSLSKSFTSTAVGFAVQEGLLGVNDQVISFFPDDLPESVSDNMAAMRVKDLLTMTTGHAVDTTMMVFPRGLVNWAQSIFLVSVDFPPGSHFLYNTGATYLLSCIVQKVTGKTLLEYLTPRLFTPLQITDATWDSCPRGINTGGWGLSLKTEDLAKFAQFYLQKGVWNGNQLLSREWITEATSKQVRNDLGERKKEPVDWRQGYGYQFWRCQHGAYRGDGAYGQYCVVMPEQNAVLVMTCETQDMQGILDRFWQYVLPTMQETPLSNHPAVQQELHNRLTSLHLPLPESQPMPELAGMISGKIFKLEANDAGIEKISFSFDSRGSIFRLWDGNGEHQLPCGNGEWVNSEAQMPIMQLNLLHLVLNWEVHGPVRVAACGHWKDASTYIMTWQYLETPHSNTITCKFMGGEIQITRTSSISDPSLPPQVAGEIQFKGEIEY